MYVIDDLAKAQVALPTVVTVGAFDGVHRGHQYLISGLVKAARSSHRLATVVTFHPHPGIVLSRQNPVRYLTTIGEKVALLAKLNLDIVAVLAFNEELARTPAREFVAHLQRALRLSELWVGANFALGANREGNVSVLQALGQEMGFSVQVVSPQVDGTEVISSTRIRHLLAQGEVREAARLLGRYYSLAGEVVRGARRGRKLGWPTANLEVRAERAVPADGVYAVYASLGENRYPGVASIGVRPTFDSGERTVETHIFDFDEDLYGCDLMVEFVERLRGEQRFECVEDLRAQIERDVHRAREILARESPAEPNPLLFLNSRNCVSKRPFEEIDHTADRAIRAHGSTVAELFAHAALGMFSLMTDPEEVAPEKEYLIELEALDLETLLVNWLNELLFLRETEKVLFKEFDILELTSTRLLARARGSLGQPTKAVVKAATFHHLAIESHPDGYEATVVFDT